MTTAEDKTVDDDGQAWVAAYGTLPDILGPTDLPKLNEGVRYLLKELRAGQAEFIGGKHLDGAYLALVAAYAFISLFRTVAEGGFGLPLDALESALWALDEGIVEPILKPARPASRGRQRAPNLRHQLRGTAVYVVRRLRDFGFSLPDAHTAVASDLDGAGVKPDRGSSGHITARTVRAWCEDIEVDVGRRGAATQRLRALLADPRNSLFDRMPPEVAVKLLRSKLQYAARVLGEGREQTRRRKKPA